MNVLIGSLLRIAALIVSVTIGLLIYTTGEQITGVVVCIICTLGLFKLIDKKYGDLEGKE